MEKLLRKGLMRALVLVITAGVITGNMYGMEKRSSSRGRSEEGSHTRFPLAESIANYSGGVKQFARFLNTINQRDFNAEMSLVSEQSEQLRQAVVAKIQWADRAGEKLSPAAQKELARIKGRGDGIEESSSLPRKPNFHEEDIKSVTTTTTIESPLAATAKATVNPRFESWLEDIVTLIPDNEEKAKKINKGQFSSGGTAGVLQDFYLHSKKDGKEYVFNDLDGWHIRGGVVLSKVRAIELLGKVDKKFEVAFGPQGSKTQYGKFHADMLEAINEANEGEVTTVQPGGKGLVRKQSIQGNIDEDAVPTKGKSKHQSASKGGSFITVYEGVDFANKEALLTAFPKPLEVNDLAEKIQAVKDAAGPAGKKSIIRTIKEAAKENAGWLPFI